MIKDNTEAKMNSNFEKITTMVENNPDMMQQIMEFAEHSDLKDAKPKGSASPILLGGTSEINLTKISPSRVEMLLWLHPVIPRGIEIKSNRMVSRNYTVIPFDDSRPSIKAAKAMEGILNNSGGVWAVKKLMDDAFGFGNAYWTLVANKQNNKVVKVIQEHPVYFRIAREKTQDSDDTKKKQQANVFSTTPDLVDWYQGPMKIDAVSRRAAKFTQLKYNPNDGKYFPTGKEFDANEVAHLTFDTWGDEVEGISLVQYLSTVLKYLLNIEKAGANTMYRNGFVQKVVSTKITNVKELKQMANSLNQINDRDVIITPDGTAITNLNPGSTDFKQFHDVFTNLLVTRLGIPKPLLTLDGTSTNKATLSEQNKDLMADLFADELRVEQVIFEQVFIPACIKEFGENFLKIPKFKFNSPTEDKDVRAERLMRLSLTAKNLIAVYDTLVNNGKTKEADIVLSKIVDDVLTPQNI